MIIYLPQQRHWALEPEWPDVIPHPTNKNGRLVKLDVSDSIMDELIEKMSKKEGGKKDGKKER